MTDLVETAQWEAGIRQLETTDPVVGGLNGVDNIAPRQLANRTAYLKAAIEAVAADLAGLAIADVDGLSSALAGKMPVYAAVPAAQAESLIYVDPYGVMAWNATHGFYRAVECGQLVVHPGASAKGGTVKANGALLNKTTYAGLWSQALDDGVAVAGGGWYPGSLIYEDYDANQFRTPDLRGEFLRMADDGRGVDAGRAFGSHQDAYAGSLTISNSVLPGGTASAAPVIDTLTINGATVNDGNTVTTDVTAGDNRPRNVALLPCIHF